MSRVGRNEPCPCGSGLKFKRCCIGREAELQRRLELLAQIATLPILFPRLRPMSPEFEAWAAARRPDPGLELSGELLSEAIDRLEAEERERIARLVGDEVAAWDALRAKVGDDEQAEDALLTGAVAAALREVFAPNRYVLELIEAGYAENEPLNGLSLVLEATQLWNVLEATDAEQTLAAIPDDLDDEEYDEAWKSAFDEVAARRWTREHEQRLTLLVERMRARLPLDGFPRASAAIAAGCDRYAADAAAPSRLGRMLLADTLRPLPLLTLPLAA
jgi:hypothetical protein